MTIVAVPKKRPVPPTLACSPSDSGATRLAPIPPSKIAPGRAAVCENERVQRLGSNPPTRLPNERPDEIRRVFAYVLGRVDSNQLPADYSRIPNYSLTIPGHA